MVRRLVDAPALGSDSFEHKLEEQMRGADRVHWQILCAVYYVYYLPSDFIKPAKKRESIEWAARQGGLTVLPPSDEIWRPLDGGFTRTGLKYHYKYAQFWLILLFAQRAKAEPNRPALLRDPQRMQQALDDILQSISTKNDRAYDMRHAMLYLAFPDLYERTISTSQKKDILASFRSRVAGSLPQDQDRALLAVREALAPTYNTAERSFDYYLDLKDKWRPTETIIIPPPDPTPPPVVPLPLPDEDLRRIQSALAYTRNVILYGPPGTGKTYQAMRAARFLVGAQTQGVAAPDGDRVMWATFHQSYSYEDFIEGLRPLPHAEGREGVAYAVVPGVFRRICQRAAADPQHPYVLVIDEINRGNIAKILGELITLLEDDKRAGQPGALAVSLPYSGEAFSVPANLSIIGTMNSTDRSIALLDVALRRRFAFVEMLPKPELLDGSIVESAESSLDLGQLLRSLNSRISRHLGHDHRIGHSYFLRVAQVEPGARLGLLEFVWNHQIQPMLEEFFYTQRDQLAELLAPLNTDTTTDAAITGDGAADLGLDRLAGDELLAALASLAQQPG